MKQTFDPHDPAALDAALADLAQDEVKLRPAFRDELLHDAARVTRPSGQPKPWTRLIEWLGIAGLPAAALAGAWIGVTNPALVLDASPWGEEAALLPTGLDDEGSDVLFEVFGTSWDSLEAFE